MTLALAPDESIMDTADTIDTADATFAVAQPTGAAVAVDPTDELVERVRPWAAHAVDALQIAAKLESEGVTDRVAVGRHRRADVFGLAEEVHRRLAGGPVPPRPVYGPTRPDRAPEPPRRRAIRDLSHGLLYLLPSAAFPAALALLPDRALVMVVVLTGAVGWIWSSVASWLAYQYLGARRAGSAARLLRWSTVAGLPVAGVAAFAVTQATDGRLGLVALAAAMMAYQMASTVLMFYRGEVWLALVMAPAVVGGFGFFAFGMEFAPWALVGAGAAILCALVLALGRTVVSTRRVGSHRTVDHRIATPRRVMLVTAYSGLAAVFLLHAQAPYLSTRLDIVLSVGPLLAGMGVVEWRARRYVETAPALLARVAEPAQFARGMRLRLVIETLACVAAVAVLAAPVLAGLAVIGLLSAPAIAMTGAAAALGGVYFLGFVLAGQGRFGTLAAALATATAAHLVAAALLSASPLADTLAFLGSAVLLGVIELASLAGAVGQAWRYRITQGDECTP